ncbi:helix-turn-helix domain-containing protein [Agathobaculum sp. LCP25S3_E8]|uniref:helix-turn-helix domain-containing protein n=1 Tax=Agathobaculum sp. LCP25S3_E8 TaxID=3438735 RepID=UPI003F8EB645
MLSVQTKVNSRFATLLGERRMKISEVARATGISRTTLTNLYYGKGEAVSFSVLGRLCGYLSCSVGDILEVCQEVQK